MYIDITIIYAFIAAVMCGITSYTVMQYNTLRGSIEDADVLDEYIESPDYSQGILDFYRKLIIEWTTIKFMEWNRKYILDKTNLHQIKGFFSTVLKEFLDNELVNSPVKYSYCLFTQVFLHQYIIIIAGNTLDKLIHQQLGNESMY